jgi:hypothetical protein
MKIKKRNEGKQADLTMKTLVTVILLIIGFGIVLFVYYQLNWTGQVNREVCHQSVITRATLPSTAGIREYVPLKCKTRKVCITTGLIGGNCQEFKNEEGITKLKVKNKEQIERFIAQDMIECWSMMGEGKVSVFGDWLTGYGIGKVGSSCVICSRIAFDKVKLQEAGIYVEEIDVLTYMLTHKVPDKNISYYNYMAGEGGKMSFNFGKEMEIVNIESLTVNEDGKIVEKAGLPGKAEFTDPSVPAASSGSIDEIGIMFMQISAPRNSELFRKQLQTIVGGVGASFVLAPHVTVSAISNVYTWAIVAIVGGYGQLNTLNNRAVTAGFCGDISTGTEARDGCSVVRMIDYNSEDVSKYCNIVESIP